MILRATCIKSCNTFLALVGCLNVKAACCSTLLCLNKDRANVPVHVQKFPVTPRAMIVQLCWIRIFAGFHCSRTLERPPFFFREEEAGSDLTIRFAANSLGSRSVVIPRNSSSDAPVRQRAITYGQMFLVSIFDRAWPLRSWDSLKNNVTVNISIWDI